MLIYGPIEVLISVLYHCNILTTNNQSSDGSHDKSMLITSSSSTY